MESISEAYEEGLNDGKRMSMEYYSLPKFDELIKGIENGDDIKAVLKSLKYHKSCYEERLSE